MTIRQLVFSVAFCLFLAEYVSATEHCTVPSQRVQCGHLTCNETSGLCVPCTLSEDCFEDALECREGRCLLKSMSDIPLLQLSGGALVVVTVCSIAVVAGLGGGGILVPLFAAILDVPIASAVAFSHSAISGQSLLNCAMSVQKTMSTTDGGSRPLINYQYLSILLPLCLAGTLLGSMLSRIVPDWLRLALLFGLLSAVLSKVVDRAKRQFQSDNLRSSDHHDHVTQRGDATTIATVEKIDHDDDDSTTQIHLPQYPMWELVMILGCCIFLLLCNVARSTVATCGSWTYLALLISPLVVLLLIFWICRTRTQNLMRHIAAGTLPPDHLTFQWNDKTTLFFPLVAILAGGAASMLGIGGGLVLSFVLFEAGLSPEEASATSGFATMVIASESAIQLMLQHQLPLSFALWFALFGVGSTILGTNVFMRYIKRTQKMYLIVVSLAFVVGGSLICLTTYGIYDAVIVMKHDGSLFSFGHFCKVI